VRWYKKQHGLTKYPLVHTDAIQAVNYLDIHVERLGVDLMSLSGSKIYGPKSSGVLYVRHKESLSSMFFGGDQEFGLRAGTEDVAQVVGFTKALEITRITADSEKNRLELLRNMFVDLLIKNIPGIVINGSLVERNANNINISIPGISGERLVIELDAHGICAASKSACKEDDGEASHVIAAIRKEGGNLSVTDGAVRFTMGRTTTKRDVVTTVKALKEIVDRIRAFEKTVKK
jgi:cysteine desulfurase